MHLPRPTRWRAFASAHYRPFQAIAVGQAFTGSYASDALFVPLLLRLGAPATLVVAVGAAPVGGAALQAFAPQILRRMQGNLRGLTLALALAEIRGFVLAAIVAAVASGIVGQLEGIVLISITVAIGQTAGVLSGSNISLWTAVVLPDTERRLVGPRMGALTMALSRLPRPGRVLVARETAAGTEAPPGFRRFMDVSVIASFGQGLLPALSLYALSVLGTTPGFAVALSSPAWGQRARWPAPSPRAPSSSAARRAACCGPASSSGQSRPCAAPRPSPRIRSRRCSFWSALRCSTAAGTPASLRRTSASSGSSRRRLASSTRAGSWAERPRPRVREPSCAPRRSRSLPRSCGRPTRPCTPDRRSADRSRRCAPRSPHHG